MATFILKNTTNSAPVTATGQLEFNTDRNTLVVGDGTNQVVIAKMDVENSGSFILTGDIKLSGSIYLGDNLANDTVNINSPFSGSIIPSGSNVFDLGSSNLKYRNVYATSISGAIAATNGVISGSSQIVASLPAGVVSGSSQIVYSNISGIPSNIVSASTDTANVDITITNGNISADLKGGVVSSSAQIIDVIGSLNTYTSSNDSKWSTLLVVTQSLNSFTSSQNTINSGYNSYTQSTNIRLTNLESTSASVNSLITNLNSFTSSQIAQNSTIGTYTASVESRFTTLGTLTGSISTEQTNQNNRLTALEISSGAVNTYTQSLKDAIDVTGGNTTIKGNLIVAGTTTAVQSTTLNVADKNIVIASGSVNSAASDGAGITIDGAGVSMSWNDTNQRMDLNKPLAILGSISSSTIVGLNGATVSAYSTSVDSRFVTLSGRVNQLEITSGAVNLFTQSVDSKFNTLASYTASNDTLNTTQNSRLDQLSTVSGSTIVRLNNLETTSASVSSSIGTINSFTSSQLSQNTQLATTTGSYNTRFTTLATVTGSYDTRFSTLASYTASNDTTNTTQNSRLDQLSTASGSAIVRLNNLETTSASVNTSISNINIATSSLNDWSASVRVNITNIHNFTASVSSSLSAIYQTTASLNSATASLFASASLLTASFTQLRSDFNILTASVDPGNVSAQFSNINDRFSAIGTLTGSYDNRWNTLSQVTASLISTTASLNTFTSSQNSINSGYNSYTSSTNIRLTNVETTTSSLNTSVTNINSYTSSLRTAITVAGSDVTINGNLTVAGTTTQINSTQVNIGENILELNFGGSANTAGIYTKDATGGSTISGSLLWDATNDRWIAGASGSEAKVLTDGMGILSGSGQLGGIYETTGRSIVSGSSQIVPLLPAGTVSGSSQVIGILTSLNSYTASNDSTNTTQNSRLSALEIETLNLESFTSSINTTIKNQLNANTVVSGSSQVIGILASLNTFTSSLDATYATEAEVAAGYEAKGRGIFSGSSQIPNASISNAQLANSAITIAGTSVSLGNSITLATITAGSGIISGSGQLGGIYETTGRGIVSGSAQIVPLLPSGVVSGSSQVSYTGLSNIPAGIISGAAQLTGDFDTRYLNTNGDGVFSSSVQIGNYVATITGTSNQVVVAGSGNNAAAITLSTPQNIHTSATPQFGSLGIGTAASGVTGEIRATGDITAFYSSDERLKENITPIQNALEKVEAISGNTYDWKDGFETIHSHKGHDLGVIAQEVQSILPEVVTERDNGYLAVDYIKLVPVLIQAVKELSAKVKELESK